jgi:hypothetical protein
MISQKTKTQIAHAYGFKHKGMFLKLLEDKGIELPSSKLLDQDTQVALYARIGIAKGIAEEEKAILLPLVVAYCEKHGLPTDINFLLPKTREEVAEAYGYYCTRTFTRRLEKNDIKLPAYKLLDHETQIYLYARMGIPKGLAAEESKIATKAVTIYCENNNLPPHIIIN